jgi:hypothetical protein
LNDQEITLGTWVSHQRISYNGNQLSSERIKELERLPGWTWNAIEAQFEQAFNALQQFVEREGHVSPRQTHIEVLVGNEIQLGAWITSQRQLYKKSRLGTDMIKRFEELPDWIWDPYEAQFEQTFSALVQFVEREGRTNPSRDNIEVLDGQEFRIGNWVVAQRQKYRRKQLSAEHIKKLEEIPGWIWDPTGK